MQLFELVSPRLFRPLAGPNRAFYAELLLLLWEECRHTADYSISRAEAVSRAEDYFAALAKPLALDAENKAAQKKLDGPISFAGKDTQLLASSPRKLFLEKTEAYNTQVKAAIEQAGQKKA